LPAAGKQLDFLLTPDEGCGLPMAVRHEGDVIHVSLSLREAG
jgi:hypothetical protein